ncbi:hypothetical protein M434DRAFT_39070 [Hypoxylon sp. CO27-5]|nr:hypothetical protein M434DRAFT_39070 [Hypoxylon sp. CO27-5]
MSSKKDKDTEASLQHHIHLHNMIPHPKLTLRVSEILSPLSGEILHRASAEATTGRGLRDSPVPNGTGVLTSATVHHQAIKSWRKLLLLQNSKPPPRTWSLLVLSSELETRAATDAVPTTPAYVSDVPTSPPPSPIGHKAHTPDPAGSPILGRLNRREGITGTTKVDTTSATPVWLWNFEAVVGSMATAATTPTPTTHAAAVGEKEDQEQQDWEDDSNLMALIYHGVIVASNAAIGIED